MIEFKKAFDHLKKDSVMKSLIKKIGDQITIKDRAEKNLALALSLLIIEQQVSFKAAITIKSRFRELIKNKTNKEILNIETEKLKSVGITYKKVEYIKNVFKYFENNKFDFFSESKEKVIKELIGIKGIGQWTAEMFLIFIRFDLDVFSKGDLALINSIKINYKITDLDDYRLKEITENWSPYKTIASLLLWKSIEEGVFS
ncbi:MAG: hypothetical protein CMC72_03625 [Flavobacteriaceae bacterium]|nr:hypothetical protein [Flavobacteriaceae bacterium]